MNNFKLVYHLNTKLESSIDFGQGGVFLVSFKQMLRQRFSQIWEDDVRELTLLSLRLFVAYLSRADTGLLECSHALNFSLNQIRVSGYLKQTLLIILSDIFYQVKLIKLPDFKKLVDGKFLLQDVTKQRFRKVFFLLIIFLG